MYGWMLIICIGNLNLHFACLSGYLKVQNRSTLYYRWCYVNTVTFSDVKNLIRPRTRYNINNIDKQHENLVVHT